jgi:hypothetical protein
MLLSTSLDINVRPEFSESQSENIGHRKLPQTNLRKEILGNMKQVFVLL